MKQFAVIIVLALGCSRVLAHCSDKELGKIIFQSYDSLRNEMIRTAFEIGGIKDSAFLKAISEGRADSVLKHYQTDSVMQCLIKASNMEILEKDYTKYNVILRNIRANLMGHLLINDYNHEEEILKKFSVHRQGLDRLYDEIRDYMNAQGNDSALSAFQVKWPNSKLGKLIHLSKKKGKDTNFFFIAFMSAILVIFILVVLFFAFKLMKRKITINEMRQQGGIDPVFRSN